MESSTGGSGGGGDDDFGLNIVAIPAAASTKNENPKPKKKRNKFDKRRSMKKRLDGETNGTIPYSPPAEIEGVNAVSSEADQTLDDAATQEENKLTAPPLEQLEDAYPEDFPPKEEEVIPRSTSHLPDDDEERAKYLAEFHARPLELDRRAGALKQVTSSRDSQHLFAEIRTWADCALPDRLVHALQSPHFDVQQPTVIQTKAVPAFTQDEGRHNILLHSETGSGKTLAYLLPIVRSLTISESGEPRKMERSRFGTRCLILCPTKELASQTFDVVERLCSNSFNWIVPGSLLGEENRKSEKARIRKGLGIIVATPGRLLDHMQKTESLLMALKGNLEWLVLDEADRLLDMGLGGQVKQIVQRIRSNQPGSGPNASGITWRSVLVSATVTASIESLAKETLVGKHSSWVWVRGVDKTAQDSNETELASSTPRQLAQNHMTVSAKFRLAALIALLAKRVAKKERALIFLDTCASVDYHHALLSAMDSIMDSTNDALEKGIFGSHCRIFKLHGSVSHTERQLTIRQFLKPPKEESDGKAAILLATDVAARGLNLHNCDWTIQYDPPSEVSDYVHRAGRVARAGRAGHSLLFLLPSERPYLDALKQRGVKNLPAVSLSSTLAAAAKVCSSLTDKGVSHSGGGLGQSRSTGSRAGEAFCSELQRRFEECVKLDDEEARRANKAKKKEDRKAGIRTAPVTGALLEQARAAFLSHIRAYPTREKAVKHIFSARALHLGHVARSFALSEPPKKLSNKTRNQASKNGESDGKKRSAALTFDVEDGMEGKRTRPKRVKGPHPDDTKKNRSIMNANAAKLHGLDSL